VENEPTEVDMVWKVRCRVSGGVTGTREAFLRIDGNVWESQDEHRAVAQAKELTEKMNSNPHGTATFEYWPVEASMTRAAMWMGSEVVLCELCSHPLEDSFVDGRTKMGPWAKMCDGCHLEHGTGLGLGRGQLYRKNLKSEWWKEEV
jgi:hypothetical protein